MATKQKPLLPSKHFIELHHAFVFISLFLVLLVSIPLLIAAVKFSTQKKAQNAYHKEKLIIAHGAHYVADQILIKYVDGKSPMELKDEIAAGHTINGLFNSVANGITNKKPPEKELEELKATLLKAHVTEEQPAFKGSSPQLREYYVLKLSPGSNIAEAQNILNASELIDFAHPDYTATPQDTPNDPSFASQWSLQKIQMNQAWNITHGSNNVIVSVVDTGIDYTNPDLAARNIIHGRDYFYNTNKPMDLRGHGTHVAGIIGATTNNGEGVAGINWDVTLMANKVCGNSLNEADPQSMCPTLYMANAIIDSVNAGAKVINMSLAGPGVCSQNPMLQDAVNQAVGAGVLVVAASGNGDAQANPLDASTFFPASCGNVFVVGATGPNDERAFYSNYGSVVQIAAPGGDPIRTNSSICDNSRCILSTYVNPSYQLEAGTSMASPHVAGVAALLFAQNSALSPSQVKSCILQGADSITTDLPIGGKRLNAFGALTACRDVVGVPVATLASTPTATPPLQATVTPIPTAIPIITQAPINRMVNGIVFIDNNNDSKFEVGETPYGGAEVILSGQQTVDTFTHGDGTFSIENLPAGNYSLIFKVLNQVIGPIPFTLGDNSVSLALPLPPNFAQSPIIITPGITTNPILPGSHSTPTPAPNVILPTSAPLNSSPQNNSETKSVILYDCREVTSSTTQNGKQVQLTKLECSPF